MRNRLSQTFEEALVSYPGATRNVSGLAAHGHRYQELVSLNDTEISTLSLSAGASSLIFLRNFQYSSTVEPPNKGYVGTRSFVVYREVSFIRRLKCTGIVGIETSRFVLYREL